VSAIKLRPNNEDVETYRPNDMSWEMLGYLHQELGVCYEVKSYVEEDCSKPSALAELNEWQAKLVVKKIDGFGFDRCRKLHERLEKEGKMKAELKVFWLWVLEWGKWLEKSGGYIRD